MRVGTQEAALQGGRDGWGGGPRTHSAGAAEADHLDGRDGVDDHLRELVLRGQEGGRHVVRASASNGLASGAGCATDLISAIVLYALFAPGPSPARLLGATRCWTSLNAPRLKSGKKLAQRLQTATRSRAGPAKRLEIAAGHRQGG